MLLSVFKKYSNKNQHVHIRKHITINKMHYLLQEKLKIMHWKQSRINWCNLCLGRASSLTLRLIDLMLVVICWKYWWCREMLEPKQSPNIPWMSRLTGKHVWFQHYLDSRFWVWAKIYRGRARKFGTRRCTAECTLALTGKTAIALAYALTNYAYMSDRNKNNT